MKLICFQGKDKENWGQLNGVIKNGDWEDIIVIKRKDVNNFKSDKEIKRISINTEKPLIEIKNELLIILKRELREEFEVALSIASGTGKEHMALISALLSIPLGIRLVAFTKKGIETI